MITKGPDDRLNLVVVDPGEIVDVDERQAWLVAKFKAYVSYCLAPSFKEQHPGVALESVQFLVACATPPTPAMLAIEGVATRGRKSVTIPVVYQVF